MFPSLGVGTTCYVDDDDMSKKGNKLRACHTKQKLKFCHWSLHRKNVQMRKLTHRRKEDLEPKIYGMCSSGIHTPRSLMLLMMFCLWKKQTKTTNISLPKKETFSLCTNLHSIKLLSGILAGATEFKHCCKILP